MLKGEILLPVSDHIVHTGHFSCNLQCDALLKGLLNEVDVSCLWDYRFPSLNSFEHREQ